MDPDMQTAGLTTRFTTALAKVQVCKEEFLVAQRANADLTAALRVAMKHSPAPEVRSVEPTQASCQLLIDLQSAMAKQDAASRPAAPGAGASDVVSSIKAAMAQQHDLSTRVHLERVRVETALAAAAASAAVAATTSRATSLPVDPGSAAACATSVMASLKTAMAKQESLNARVVVERAAAETALAAAAATAATPSRATAPSAARSQHAQLVGAAALPASAAAAPAAAGDDVFASLKAVLSRQHDVAQRELSERVAAEVELSSNSSALGGAAALAARAPASVDSATLAAVQSALARQQVARLSQAQAQAHAQEQAPAETHAGLLEARVATSSAAAAAVAASPPAPPGSSAGDVFASVKRALARCEEIDKREAWERSAAESALKAKMLAAQRGEIVTDSMAHSDENEKGK